MNTLLYGVDVSALTQEPPPVLHKEAMVDKSTSYMAYGHRVNMVLPFDIDVAFVLLCGKSAARMCD